MKKERTSWTKPLLAVILVVAVLLAGFSVYQEQRVTKQAASTTTPPSCPGKVIWNTQTPASAVPILSMQPNSTATACIIYQTLWQGNASAVEDLSETAVNGNTSTTFRIFSPFEWKTSFSIDQWGCVPVINCPLCVCTFAYLGRNNFAVQASPSSVNVTAPTDYIRVMYTITALSNSTGYYHDSLPYSSVPLECPESMWLVVGQPPASRTPPDWGSAGGCPEGYTDLNPVVISVSAVGMNVTYNYPLSNSTT